MIFFILLSFNFLLQICVYIVISLSFTDLKDNVEGMCDLYDKIRTGTEERNKALEHTLGVADKFWDDLNVLSNTLKDIQDNFSAQDLPAINPSDIREQQDNLAVSLLLVLYQLCVML